MDLCFLHTQTRLSMMKKWMLFWILPVFVLIAAYPNGPAKEGAQTTSAPLPGGSTEYSCNNCHAQGTNYGVQAVIGLYESGTSNLVTEYTPGTAYDVKMSASTTINPAGFGFQMTAIRNDNLESVGQFSLPMNAARIIALNNRTYVEQTQRLANSVKTYFAKWQAPQAGTGTVTFYGNVLAVNGNGGTNGDMTAKATLMLREKSLTSTERETPRDVFSLQVFPNPGAGNVQILSARPVVLRVFDLNGRQVFASAQTQLIEINTQNWPRGYYLIRAEDNQHTTLKPFVKH